MLNLNFVSFNKHFYFLSSRLQHLDLITSVVHFHLFFSLPHNFQSNNWKDNSESILLVNFFFFWYEESHWKGFFFFFFFFSFRRLLYSRHNLWLKTVRNKTSYCISTSCLTNWNDEMKNGFLTWEDKKQFFMKTSERLRFTLSHKNSLENFSSSSLKPLKWKKQKNFGRSTSRN